MNDDHHMYYIRLGDKKVHLDKCGECELCAFSSKSHSEEYVGFRIEKNWGAIKKL
jgi:hypothetical protein